MSDPIIKDCFDRCQIKSCPQHGYDDLSPKVCAMDVIEDRYKRCDKPPKRKCYTCSEREYGRACHKCSHNSNAKPQGEW